MIQLDCSYIPFWLRQFEDPQPPEYVIREAVGNFTLAIDRSLRVACFKNIVLRIPFRHDVVRYLFKDKVKLTLGDFNTEYFPYGWNQWYRQHGGSTNASYAGHTIVFPIRIQSFLEWTGCNGFVQDNDGTMTPK